MMVESLHFSGTKMARMISFLRAYERVIALLAAFLVADDTGIIAVPNPWRILFAVPLVV
jgi:hypothetical protein